ncbi:hypothetical protein Fot_49540 [Forsythia ovata]|uniref:Uncharacterized protein n=1 Tax=Forsythia ovata TaxID=205694 RepID=A0ABD1QD67_9LAMI
MLNSDFEGFHHPCPGVLVEDVNRRMCFNGACSRIVSSGKEVHYVDMHDACQQVVKFADVRKKAITLVTGQYQLVGWTLNLFDHLSQKFGEVYVMLIHAWDQQQVEVKRE